METIAAISTAPGNSGIGIVRLSGDNVFEVIKKIFKPKKQSKIVGYQMKYGYIFEKKQEIVDEVLVSYFIAPKSYTGENMCEINSHGNNIVLKKILELCIKNGAKLAEPGEFTKRAFLNGKIDLLQAESVIELINSKSEIEQKNAIKTLEGELSKKLKTIKKEILENLTNIEVSVDYPEYDIEEKNSKEILESIENILKEIKKLENSFENGKLLQDGIKITIVGRPNTGKSTLLNKILKEERAIVTNIEGTTRDTIEEFIKIRGIPFKIIDTAGIRNTENEIEKIGIQKSKKTIEEADIIIAIFDISKKLEDEDFEILRLIEDKKKIILLNKTDLGNKRISIEDFKNIKKNEIIEISIKNNFDTEEFFKKIEKIFNIEKISTENTSIITNIRHKENLKETRINLEQAIKTIREGVEIDISAIFLKKALESIDNITGENVTEDIINDIFSKFCLGK